jgi:hypothetical protein
LGEEEGWRILHQIIERIELSLSWKSFGASDEPSALEGAFTADKEANRKKLAEK